MGGNAPPTARPRQQTTHVEVEVGERRPRSSVFLNSLFRSGDAGAANLTRTRTHTYAVKHKANSVPPSPIGSQLLSHAPIRHTRHAHKHTQHQHTHPPSPLLPSRTCRRVLSPFGPPHTHKHMHTTHPRMCACACRRRTPQRNTHHHSTPSSTHTLQHPHTCARTHGCAYACVCVSLLCAGGQRLVQEHVLPCGGAELDGVLRLRVATSHTHTKAQAHVLVRWDGGKNGRGVHMLLSHTPHTG